jgi:hypothetical protein
MHVNVATSRFASRFARRLDGCLLDRRQGDQPARVRLRDEITKPG